MSTAYLAFIAVSITVMIGLGVHATREHAHALVRLERTAAMVRTYRLTDLSLFTEARYTRNPSLADLNTAFQDHPFSFEHFPSGSLEPVPSILRMR